MNKLFFLRRLSALLLLLLLLLVGKRARAGEDAQRQASILKMQKELTKAKTNQERKDVLAKYKSLFQTPKKTKAHAQTTAAGTSSPSVVEANTPALESSPSSGGGASPQSSITDEYAKLAASFGAQKEEKKEVIYYMCKNIRGSTMRRILENFLSTSGTVADVGEVDMVVISDIKSNIKRMREIAERVDIRVPQILVEAQIVELTIDDDFQKEIKLAFKTSPFDSNTLIRSIFTNLTPLGVGGGLNPEPTNTATFPSTIQGGQFNLRPYIRHYGGSRRNELNLFLRYLETKGKAKILSAPNLILRRGTEGSIITGEEVPIVQQTAASAGISTSTEFKDVGIRLDLKPIMITGDTVRLSVNPKVSTVTGFTQGAVPNPIIAKREALTELEIKDGELLTIGGLLQSEERVSKRRVPIAGALPIVGHFFRGTRIQKVKTQLVFFLFIKILDEGDKNGVVIIRPEELPHSVTKEMDRLDSEVKKNQKAQILQDLESFRKDGQP